MTKELDKYIMEDMGLLAFDSKFFLYSDGTVIAKDMRLQPLVDRVQRSIGDGINAFYNMNKRAYGNAGYLPLAIFESVRKEYSESCNMQYNRFHKEIISEANVFYAEPELKKK